MDEWKMEKFGDQKVFSAGLNTPVNRDVYLYGKWGEGERPFIDARKPGQMVRLEKQPLYYELSEGSSLFHKCIVEKMGQEILDAIIETARAGGVRNLLLLNQSVIVQALREYEERHLKGEEEDYV